MVTVYQPCEVCCARSIERNCRFRMSRKEITISDQVDVNVEEILRDFDHHVAIPAIAPLPAVFSPPVGARVHSQSFLCILTRLALPWCSTGTSSP